MAECSGAEPISVMVQAMWEQAVQAEASIAEAATASSCYAGQSTLAPSSSHTALDAAWEHVLQLCELSDDPSPAFEVWDAPAGCRPQAAAAEGGVHSMQSDPATSAQAPNSHRPPQPDKGTVRRLLSTLIPGKHL